MSEIEVVTADDVEALRTRINELKDGIKLLPIFTWSGQESVITLEAPGLIFALENLIALAAKDD
jgi:hypothetical protein